MTTSEAEFIGMVLPILEPRTALVLSAQCFHLSDIVSKGPAPQLYKRNLEECT